MFWCVLYYLGAFGNVWLAYGTRCKTGRTRKKFVPQSRVVISRDTRTRSTPLDPKLMFLCVSYYFGAFGTVWLPYENRCKTGRASAKVRATKLRRNFSKKRTQSSPLDPKLTFYCVSFYLGAFRTIWFPYETQCNTNRSSAKVRATKSRQNFLQRTHPIHPIGP